MRRSSVRKVILLVPETDEIGALEVYGELFALIEALAVPGDDAEALVGVRHATIENDRLGPQRIAGIDVLVIGELVHSEERSAAFAQVLDGEAEHGGEDQQWIGHDTRMAVHAGVGGVVIVRIEMQRQGREESALRLGDGPPPMVLEHASGLEILVAVALGDESRARPEIVRHSCPSSLEAANLSLSGHDMEDMPVLGIATRCDAVGFFLVEHLKLEAFEQSLGFGTARSEEHT